MAEAKNKLTMEFSTTLTLNEKEIHALEAIVGYGEKAFLELFKTTCGQAYIRGAEDGVKSLFYAISTQVAPMHAEIQKAKKLLLEKVG